MVPAQRRGAGGIAGEGVIPGRDHPLPANVGALLQELIRIPSVNPDGASGADAGTLGEQACAEFVGEFLRSIGAEVTLEEVLPRRPNVIGRFPAVPGREKRKRGPRLLFAPHTDTVGVAHMTIDPFGGELRDGRIYGRGASDTKGTMAAMLWALREIRDTIPSLDAEVAFAGLMGEETGQPGSRHFVRAHGGEFDFALVGEPTSLDIVYTHKGTLWVEIATAGRAAHGATPEKGENAIVKMAALIGDLDTAFRAQLAAFDHPVLGPSTINIGRCRGGLRTNIVPDRCVCELDLRLTPALGVPEARDLLGAFLRARDPDIVLKTLLESSPLATDTAHPVVQRLLATERDAPGRHPVLAGAPWFCDAAVLAEGGIPSVAIGPGTIDQAHTADEFLALADLEAGAAFFRKFLESFRGG